jgi:hypothetical protein
MEKFQCQWKNYYFDQKNSTGNGIFLITRFLETFHSVAFEFVEIGNDFLNFAFVDLPVAAVPAAEF